MGDTIMNKEISKMGVSVMNDMNEEISNMGVSIVNEVNLGIGFNDVGFSDRILQLHIAPNNDFGTQRYVEYFSSIHANESELGSDFIVKTFRICSLVLASKSLFFFKLFTNGMKESQNNEELILRINASEEAAFMDLLYFMYDKSLKADSTLELVDLLVAADKFQVTSCVKHCIDLLLKKPLTTQYALLVMEELSPLLGDVTRPLIDAAHQYFSSRYSNFNESQQEEAMSLPLCALEVVLGSEDLNVSSDDAVFEFIVKWGRLHYPQLEERRKILTNRLLRFICFPCMSSLKLKEAVASPDFDYERVSKLVLNALFTKIEQPNGHNSVPVNNTPFPTTALETCGFPRRVNHRRVVYFDISIRDCMDKLPAGQRLYSEAFCLGGRCFCLFAQRMIRQSVAQFSLFLEMIGSESCTLGFEIAVMTKPSREFQTQSTLQNSLYTGTERTKGTSLFEWTKLIRDNSVYFIDGILHLRAQLNIIN